MGLLTAAIKEFVKQEKLGFVGTVCPDGTPNLSPKGTTTVWDDEHLVFADIYSPATTRNILFNPAIELNVVDIFLRKATVSKAPLPCFQKESCSKKFRRFTKLPGLRTSLKYRINKGG
jgi:uncharacterized protein